MTYEALPSTFNGNEVYSKSSQPCTGSRWDMSKRNELLLKPREMNFALGVVEPGCFDKGKVQVEFSFREVSARNLILT